MKDKETDRLKDTQTDILKDRKTKRQETKWYKESCQELQQQLPSEVALKKIKRQIDRKTRRQRYLKKERQMSNGHKR